MPELHLSGIGFATPFAPTTATPNLTFAQHQLAQIAPTGKIPLVEAVIGTS